MKQCVVLSYFLIFFFFQAEDGIRDLTVTGVQTCALPISWLARMPALYNGVMGSPWMRDVLSRRIGMVDGDRKSTRLNSSHSQISYAVFCLKKKKKKTNQQKPSLTR